MKIGDWEFDVVEYDAEGDVLYLSIGAPREAVGEETPEDHVLLFDSHTSEFCGLTLIGIGQLLELHGDDLRVTVPHAERIDAADLKPALLPA